MFAWAGTGLIGLVTVLTVVQICAVTPSISGLIVLGLVVVLVGFIPFGVTALGRAWRAGGVDVAYPLYFAGELAITAYLFRLSTGTWYNYAVQAIFFGSVIAAHAWRGPWIDRLRCAPSWASRLRPSLFRHLR